MRSIRRRNSDQHSSNTHSSPGRGRLGFINIGLALLITMFTLFGTGPAIADDPPSAPPPAATTAPADPGGESGDTAKPPAAPTNTPGEPAQGDTSAGAPEGGGSDEGESVPPVVAKEAAAAAATDAKVQIQVGGDRTGMGGSAVSNLQGVQLGIYTSSSSTTPVATCTSDPSGICELIVPNPGGNKYWVKQISAPTNWFMNPKLQTNWVSGWGGDNPATVDYIFQTPKLYSGTTYDSDDVMDTEGDPNDSDGTNAIWQNSRDNKSLVQRCGIKVALLLDISGSVGSAGMVSLKAAADKMVDSLTGTPSQMAVFNFASHSPESGTSNHPTLVPVATTSQASAFKALYSGWTSGGGTNWDEALYKVSQAAATYDVVVMITDGKPTFWSDGPSGSGSTTRFMEIEAGIFSANKLKNKGTRIMALGVGSGVSGDAKYNLAAISGPTAYNGSNASTADYFQAVNYDSAGEALKQLALGNCLGSVSVVKHIVPQGNAAGNITGATPAGAGWKFDGSVVPPTNGVTINPTSGTTDVTSAVNFKLDYPGGVNSATVQVGEDLTGHTNYELFPVGSKNAVCKNVSTNESVSVTNVGTNGFTVNAPSTAPITCNVYNQYKAPPAWELTKTSSVDSPPLAPGGTLTYTLHAKNTGTVAGTNLTATDDLTNVLNNATLVTPLAAGLSISGNTLTWNIGSLGVGATKTVSFQVKVKDGAWDKTLTNVAIPGTYGHCPTSGEPDCTTTDTTGKRPKLTLVKSLDRNGTNDTTAATAWTLSAGPLSGATGSAAVTGAGIDPGSYTLGESGPATYSNEGWTCTNAQGKVTKVTLAVNENVTCTVVNKAKVPKLTLKKWVDNTNGGTAVANDWTLMAALSTDSNVKFSGDGGFANQSVTNLGAYNLSESPKPGSPTVGYTADAWTCTNNGQTTTVTNNQVQVGLGDNVVCEIWNRSTSLGYKAVKSSQITDKPGPAGTVLPGGEITYTITVSKTGGVDGPVKIEDNLTGVFSHAAYVAGSISTGNGTASVAGNTLTWNITKLTSAGATLTYKVTVDADAWDVTLHNAITPKTPGGSCKPDCSTDNPTPKRPKLTLVKSLDRNGTNDTTAATAWTLSAGPLSGATDSAAVTGAGIDPGTYTLGESGPSTYTNQGWTCSNAQGVVTKVTLAVNENVTCTVVNKAVKPKLTLVKQVNTQNGGSAVPADWKLSATLDGAGSPALSGDGGASGTLDSVGDYKLAEAANPSAPPGFTAGAWSCVNKADASVPAPGGVVAVGLGADITCTITNASVSLGYTAAKSSQITDKPGPGGTVLPGGEITYTVTVSKTGGVDGPVTIEDDLTQVLNHADLVGGSISTGNGSASVAGNTLTWNLAKLTSAGATLTYKVTVDADAWDVTLHNAITPKTPGGSCKPDCSTDNPTPKRPKLTLVKSLDHNNTGDTGVASDWDLQAGEQPSVKSGTTINLDPGTYGLSESGGNVGYELLGWKCTNYERGEVFVPEDAVELAANDDVTCTAYNKAMPAEYDVQKLADPASGTPVSPGQEITYTLKVTHTGGVKPNDVVVTDDLSDVLTSNATLVGGWPANTTYDEGSHLLTWNVPAMAQDQDSLQISFKVKISDSAAGKVIDNTVTSPGSNCPPMEEDDLPVLKREGDEEDFCSTSHPVTKWLLTKDSDPVTTSQVLGGSQITYTLSVTNDSEAAPLEGATVVDNLSAVLAKATMITAFPAAGGAATFDPVTKMLTWQVPTIAAGDHTPVTFSYTVQVNPDAIGVLDNVAAPGASTGEGGSPVNGSGKCKTEDGCATNHGIIVVQPPVVNPPVAPPKQWRPKALPHTGGPESLWLPFGGVLLLSGAGLVLYGRRRRDDAA